MQHMDPAKSILDLIGYAKAAEVTGRHISNVYRWTYPVEVRKGTGGVIPSREALKLLEHARANDLALTEADFLRAPTIVVPEEQGAA